MRLSLRLFLLRLRNSASSLASGSDQRRLRLLAVYFAGFFSHALLSRLFFATGVDFDYPSEFSSSSFRGGGGGGDGRSLPPPFVPKTRYEVLRFDTLDEKWLYNNVDDDPRIGLTRHHKADVADIAKQAVARLNEREEEEKAEETEEGNRREDESSERKKAKRKKNSVKKTRWKLKAYRRGWRRFDPTRGEEHKILLDVTLLEGGRTSDRRLLVTAVKPFAPATLVAMEDIVDRDWKRRQPVVHFVVPVARLSSRFDDFIVNYEDVCLKELGVRSDPRPGENSSPLRCALLLVVFDGPSHLDKDTAANVQSHLSRLKGIYGDSAFRARLVRTKTAFTRAVGMDLAVRELPLDALVFFVDVDVTFNATFVENCHLLAEKGKVVYYPIVFSQYDPAIVGNYSSSPHSASSDSKGDATKKKPPPDMRVISKLTGHWVVYGFGMVCLYKSDYDAVGGYDLSIRGWGGEDVALYDSHVRHAAIGVARACEPGLVHRYHERYCDPGLGRDQLRMCRGAAAESLGSRAQLANLVVESRKDGKRTK